MSDNGKAKFAMYWAASCGGCEIAVLNIGEKILDVDANFDVVFWPVAMDAKYKDVEAMPDKSITLCLFNGGIRNKENEHLAKLLRQKSVFLVAFGSCASEGCIPGLANFSSQKEIFDTVYDSVSTDNPDGIRPQYDYETPEGLTITIPEFYPRLKTLDQVVDVDYYMPGCPPESHQIAAVIDVVIAALKGEGELPPKGAVIGAGGSTVCDDCAPHPECEEDQEVRSHSGDGNDRSGSVPDGARAVVQRTGHPEWLWRSVPGRRRSLHRLLWRGRRCR